MNRFGKNLIRAAVSCAAVIALLFGITACKQFTADIDEDFSYWAAEPVITNFRAASPAQTSSAGVLCVSSASDAVLTLTVHNPKNFSFIMPNSPGAPTDIVSFGDDKVKGSGGAKPVYGTDYTLEPISDGKALKLTYTAAFLKANERSSANIGAAITLYSTDGRKFNQNYKFDLEANTPPKLSYVTIGKTATADASGKHYYVIILKAEDMTETAGIASELLHKDIKTLSVTGGDSADVAFTSGNTGFFVDTGVPAENRRLLAANEVVSLASDEGPTPPSDWSTLNSDTWALRYKTNIVVKAASKTYTFRLIDEKGLGSTLVSASTSETKAQDAQLFDGTTEISGTDESSPYSMNAELSAASVSVTAQTTTVDAKITGKVEKPNDSSWVPRTIDSGSRTSIDISLPAPEANQEILYKITVAAGGDGFVPGTEKTFYVKVTKKSEITVNNTDPGAWKKLKEAVQALPDGGTIIINGEIKATAGSGSNANNGVIDINKNLTIQGKTGANSDMLNANRDNLGTNAHPVFRVWGGKTLTLKNLTLKGGKGISGTFGGAVNVTGGLSKAELTDCIIEDCEADNGGAIGCGSGTTVKLTNTTIKKCKASGSGSASGGGAIFAQGATVEMTGCTLTNNEASVYGGGIYVRGGSLTLYNTTIGGEQFYDGTDSGKTKGNKAKSGGGVYIEGNGTLVTMNGGSIQYNKTIDGDGGGVCIKGDGISFTMNGGKITQCKADVTSASSRAGRGGGICVDYAPSRINITIKGTAEISHNESTCQGTGSGGGIYGETNSIITVSENATIKNNEAKGFGGGVYIKDTFKFTGGTITGNTITLGPDKLGSGIFSENSSTTLEMSGNARVTNDNDIYLPNSRVVTITGPLSQNPAARITPETYGTTTQVLAGSVALLNSEYGKFTVTPKIVSGNTEYWTVGGNGRLKQGRYTEVPHGQLEAYLTNASATEVNYIEVTGISPADLKGDTSPSPPDPGALGQKIKNNSSKKVALKLPSGLSVTDMSACFSQCENLVSLENLPSGVTNMQACFYKCENLTTGPDIPATVTMMKECFRFCKKLQSVKINRSYFGCDFYITFNGCTALENGGIKVPSAQLTNYQNAASSMGTTSNKFAGF